MQFLGIDLETYSSGNLLKSGVYRYCEAEDFEILLFGYSVDGGAVQVVDLANGEKMPREILDALTDERVVKWAFNAAFERICLSRFLGLPPGTYLDPASWRCTMIWSAYLGLPLSLMGVGAVLGLEKQKLSEGKDLIRYFCTPCNPTIANGGRRRNRPADAPDKWALFVEYNRRDVEVELAIHQRLARFPVPDAVWDEYHLDQRINDRGVLVDRTLVQKAIEMDGLSRKELVSRMKQLTDLENPNSVSQVKTWLSENGLEVDSLGKKDVKAALKDAPRQIQEVLELRLQLAKSSVRKYQAMENAVCSDNRARGMFQFYGANRTGRWSGRLIQVQNLRQNHLEDLGTARALVESGDYEAVKMLYGDVPDTLSQLVRTAFIPRKGYRFIVSDFSAIEARVLSWLAGEKWRMDVFAGNGDIYCATASRMFHCTVTKHGENGHLRQKGKQAELACIAEGQLVLTDQGLVPIEKVTADHRLWDGESWVSHEGIVYKGRREVITYEGLSATEDHLVWVEGEPEPIQLGVAAASGAHLVQTGDGRKAIRLGEDTLCRETLECKNESLLCTYAMHRLRQHPVAISVESYPREIERMSTVFPTKGNAFVARQKTHSCKAAMRKSKRQFLSQLWGSWHPIRISQREGSRIVSNQGIRITQEGNGNRSYQQRQGLFARKLAIHNPLGKQPQQAQYGSERVQTDTLALCPAGRCTQTLKRRKSESYHRGCVLGCSREKKELEDDQRTVGLYDIRNAGEHHRFTVSDRLVHNCGYGGSVGALKAMGALESGMTEEELKPLVDAWRQSNPNIVRLWWDVDKAVKEAVGKKTTTSTHGIRFSYESGFLFITLPSGRRLAYVKPRIGTNNFGGDCVTYEGVGATKKWDRIETYGPKVVENIVQAISRDILCSAMQQLKDCRICMHIHDEVVIEAPDGVELRAIEASMAVAPSWAGGLLLNADGYETDFYKKD
jgi:DNA polymerase